MQKLLRLFLAPIEVFRTGKFMGMEVETHPIAWIPFCSAVLVALPVVLLISLILLVLSPLLAIVYAIGFRQLDRDGSRPRFHEENLEIFNKKGTEQRFVPWEKIIIVETVFSPPLFHPELVLDDGERIPLYLGSRDELAIELERRGIPYSEKPSGKTDPELVGGSRREGSESSYRDPEESTHEKGPP